MYLMCCTYGTEMGKKEATTPPEQLENTPRFSRKQNMAFEFFLPGKRKLQTTRRADVIFSVRCVVQFLKAHVFVFS